MNTEKQDIQLYEKKIIKKKVKFLFSFCTNIFSIICIQKYFFLNFVYITKLFSYFWANVPALLKVIIIIYSS